VGWRAGVVHEEYGAGVSVQGGREGEGSGRERMISGGDQGEEEGKLKGVGRRAA